VLDAAQSTGVEAHVERTGRIAEPERRATSGDGDTLPKALALRHQGSGLLQRLGLVGDAGRSAADAGG
jgi:hypothetical protein